MTFRRGRSLKKTAFLAALLLSALCFVAPTARADDSDIVPRGSILLDTFAQLQRHKLLTNTPIRFGNFVGESLVTRGQLAALLLKSAPWDKTSPNSESAAAVRTAVYALDAELRHRGAKPGELLKNFRAVGKPSLGLIADLRGRTSRGDSGSDNGIVLYRASAVGDIGRDAEYGVLFANYPQQYRRLYDSDINVRGHQELSEAYFKLRGRNGLTFSVGRMPLRWGNSQRGGLFINDNAPPFDQYNVQFPFSLGKRLGRNYRFEQFGTTFKDADSRKYIGGRRIEYRFSDKWSVDFQDGYITSYGPRIIPAILVFPIPFKINTDRTGFLRGLFGRRSKDLDFDFNYFNTVSGTYRVDDRTRLFGQFMADDYSSVRGRGGARKIGYLVGGAFGKGATDLALEFSHADATTFTFKTDGLQWQREGYYIGQPAGSNSNEVFARVQHALRPNLLLHAQGRKRMRSTSSLFPVPTAETGEFGALYRFDPRQSVTAAFRYYGQERYNNALPTATSDTPANPAQPGLTTTRREFELGYSFLF